ncbi:hypothetical protein DM01DRAFT_1378645 [Hesseltinella vesiculosa]|uniref:C2H2-type domain-containing protein n=1 Tax=Hesseltinella vesiculosa TaxID=101127 RepID=A0A1X2G3I8_9FUNG|nr:hypothetical protein DM01DRAFT_1378645 [Hesseltinella vesiculosa]
MTSIQDAFPSDPCTPFLNHQATLSQYHLYSNLRTDDALSPLSPPLSAEQMSPNVMTTPEMPRSAMDTKQILPFAITSSTSRDTLQKLSKEDLIDRIITLEQVLQDCHSEFPKQDCWQCRWESCDTVTYSMSQLTEHLCRVHVGKGKAVYYCGWNGCPRRDKPFTKRHKMHNHLRTHTGERPFVCDFGGCGKRFSRPDSLSTHRKTHSNVRPFSCQECKKSYFHARSLRKHMKASSHVSSVERMA